MKSVNITIQIITIISLVVAIFLLPSQVFMFNGIKGEVGENTVAFLKGDEELKFYEPDEQAHLADVKKLMDNIRLVFWISLMISIVGMAYLRDLKVFFLGGLVGFALVALLFLASLNFNSTFLAFHETFFPQGNYLFPEDSLLIQTFPEELFRNKALLFMGLSIFISLIFMAPQYIKNKKLLSNN